MKRVLVLGGTGMLGQMVCRVLSQSEGLAVKCTSRSQSSDPLYFNVEDGTARLQQILERYGPFDYIINCIGVVKAHIDERDSDSVRRALVVNALFPHQLATVAAESKARVIQPSTDGVFSGDSDEPYMEDAQHGCVDIYGKTKSLGEVRKSGFLNIRCSIVGPDPIEKKGLLEWFVAQRVDTTIVGYTDHLWNGVTTLQFAELCQKIIQEDAFDKIWDESPVHHFCPNRPLSKFELLEIFKSVFKKTVTIKPTRSPNGALRRILATRYQSLPMLYGCDLSMEQAVQALSTLGVE